MNRVLIICGAGASSTFLALRLRGVARSRGLDLTVEAGTRFDLDDRLTGTDLLLVGPHLGAEFAELQARANDAGVGAALLPDTVFDAGGAEAAADLVADLLGAPQASTDRLTVEPT
ncbi:PTS sugar transporter subunit IIB [Herbiconiux daphne]|uniref:PTS sugar transporter subunit IIB n=1 Tax=Herbiconiux daphne TaxID=2970914 RepID=A0ABT2GXB1_9MICO|nr:PTS sugar transporter subunit IIB [Herbiconiux daphne]MCS5732589.1 PTS sugar transporter subunit IIB [Herbiconiux daphne]